jgi:hypothetical protein
MKIRQERADLFRADGKADRQTHTTKLVVALSNFADSAFKLLRRWQQIEFNLQRSNGNTIQRNIRPVWSVNKYTKIQQFYVNAHSVSHNSAACFR